MARRNAQQRDAAELAATRPADPYRGSLRDPFAARPNPPSSATLQSPPWDVTLLGPKLTESDQQAREELPPATDKTARPPTYGNPAPATFAGILGIALGAALVLFGLLLLTILSLQNEYGAPDRSFYRGTDSGYVVLSLVNFGLATCCAGGGIGLLTGHVTGRVVLTIGGWGTLMLSAFWYLRGDANPTISIVVAVAAAAMLVLSYQRSVTSWLGVLPRPQPE